MEFDLLESLRGLGKVPRLMRRLISCLEIPHSLTASLMGIRALLWIMRAAVTCASNSFLMDFGLLIKSMVYSFHMHNKAKKGFVLINHMPMSENVQSIRVAYGVFLRTVALPLPFQHT